MAASAAAVLVKVGSVMVGLAGQGSEAADTAAPDAADRGLVAEAAAGLAEVD